MMFFKYFPCILENKKFNVFEIFFILNDIMYPKNGNTGFSNLEDKGFFTSLLFWTTLEIF
jgi:hypothetical protein